MQKEQSVSIIIIPLKYTISSFNTSFPFSFQVFMSNIIHKTLTWTTSIHIGYTWTYCLLEYLLSIPLPKTNI